MSGPNSLRTAACNGSRSRRKLSVGIRGYAFLPAPLHLCEGSFCKGCGEKTVADLPGAMGPDTEEKEKGNLDFH
jgi:hypothetical protein